MAQIRSSRWWGGLTGALALAYLVGASLLMGWSVGGSSGRAASAEPSASAAEPSPTASAGPISAPDAAIPLSAFVLQSVEPGWVLTTYDSSSGRYLTAEQRAAPTIEASDQGDGVSSFPSWDRSGTRHVYLIDRVGTVYQGADLGVSSHLELRLWLPGGRTVIVARPQAPGSDQVSLHAFDVVTGALSAPFDGPDAAAPFGFGAPAAPAASPSASPGATPTPAPPAATPTPAPSWKAVAASPLWTSPEVRLAASGDALLVTDGTESRQWVRLSLDGRAIGQVIPPVAAGTFFDDPAGATYVASELVTTVSQRWVEAALEWVDYTEQHWNTVTYAAEPTGDAATDRADHGAPPEEARCDPVSWAPDRQLLDACVRADGSTVLYAVAASTDTFVRVAVIPTTASDPVFSVKPDATRVAVGDRVYSIVGELAWSLPRGEPTPTGLAWSGDLLVLWGDPAVALAPGYGASEIRVHDAFAGGAAYTLVSREGEAGFGPVLGANSGRSRPSAVRRGSSLASDSAHSALGSEAATIPHPAKSRRRDGSAREISAALSAMHHSPSPLASIHPTGPA